MVPIALPYSKSEFLAAKAKSYSKAGIKVFWSCPIFLNFFLFYQILSQGLQTGVSKLQNNSRPGTLLK